MTRTLASDRTFGIEIEAFGVDSHRLAAVLETAGIPCTVAGYNHTTSTAWKIVSDGSIQREQSFELVSPVLRGEDGVQQIRTVCAVLKELGARVAVTCGLHVHHGAADLTLQQWKNLAHNWLKYERALDQLQPASRRGNANRYCKSVLGRFDSLEAAFHAVKRATTLEELAQILLSTDRYHKLNLTAFWRHGTVEFRHHSGTVEADKIIAWVSLTQHLLENACHTHHVQTRGAHQLTSLLTTLHLPTTVQAFYRTRATQLQAISAVAA